MKTYSVIATMGSCSPFHYHYTKCGCTECLVSFLFYCLQPFKTTLVNVYVALRVFTPVAGSSYAHFIEQNGGAQYVNSEFGRYFHFVGVYTI